MKVSSASSPPCGVNKSQKQRGRCVNFLSEADSSGSFEGNMKQFLLQSPHTEGGDEGSTSQRHSASIVDEDRHDHENGFGTVAIALPFFQSPVWSPCSSDEGLAATVQPRALKFI